MTDVALRGAHNLENVLAATACVLWTGMAPEVLEHAFDVFFTTKEVGMGTGLGLSIARRVVVERHGGEISIESQPGATIVRVSLPTTQTPDQPVSGAVAQPFT